MLVDACRNDPHVGGSRSLTATEGTKQLARSLQEIKLPEGVVLMNSCAPGEISWEEQQFGHGVYMHHILEALAGAGDGDGDGALSIQELQAFAGTKTKTYVARRFSASQRPFFKLEGEGDLMQFALLPVPTGARPGPGAVGGGSSRFPARPEVKPNDPWIADSRFMRNGRANVLIGVLKGGAADRAGLRANDVLISANGNRINKNVELYDALAGAKAGDAVDFEITRDGKSMVVRVTLDPMPPDGGTGVLTAAAEAGEVWAMAELAMRYSGMLRQLSFVDEDQAESLRWIQKAVDAGPSVGLLLLANRHYAGHGGPQNVAEAARLFEQARLTALRGPDRWVADEVSVVLGEIYFKGNGVPRDRTKSLDYFRAAADAGHVRAMNFLGTMYENGEVVNKDLGKALELYQVAAEGGNPDAQYNIGIMIYNGVLSTRDLTQARRWI
jgi:hypothetical protein